MSVFFIKSVGCFRIIEVKKSNNLALELYYFVLHGADIDFCKQNMCLNGGTCQDLDGLGFRCMCQRGFEGSVCQLRSPCSQSQCVHARKCTQLATPTNEIKHDCACQPGWTGDLCDLSQSKFTRFDENPSYYAL